MNDSLRIGGDKNKDQIVYNQHIEISKSTRALGVTAALCYIKLLHRFEFSITVVGTEMYYYNNI